MVAYGNLSILALLTPLLLSACSSVILQSADGSVDRSFVGYVRVRGTPIAPAAQGGSVHEFTSAGVSAGHGFTVGWAKERVISIPIDCRVVVLLNADSVMPPLLLESLKQTSACLIQADANQRR